MNVQLNVYLSFDLCSRDPWSLKSVLVLRLQILGSFVSAKKRVNFNIFNKEQKRVFCVLAPQSPTKKTIVALLFCYIQHFKLQAYILAFILTTQP